MKTLIAGLLTMLFSPAIASGAEVVPPGAPEAPRFAVGFRVAPMLAGSIGDFGSTNSIGAEVSGHFAYRIFPFLSVGLGIEFLGWQNSKGGFEKEPALVLRIRAGAAVHERIEVYALATPGFARWTPVGGSETLSGFHLSVGAGASFRVATRAALLLELMYRSSFYDTHGMSARLSSFTPNVGVEWSF